MPDALITPTEPQLSREAKRASFWQKFFYGTGCVYELTKWIVVLLILGTLVHFYIGTLFIVEGQSMEPNFHTKEFIIVNRWKYNFRQPERGDVVVLKFPGDPEHKKYIKRLIGLPGEKVEIWNGIIYINDNKLIESYLPAKTMTYPNVNRQLGQDDYFLLGDNRPNSSDSRVWGIAPKRVLIGRAWLIVWPPEFWGMVEKPQY